MVVLPRGYSLLNLNPDYLVWNGEHDSRCNDELGNWLPLTDCVLLEGDEQGFEVASRQSVVLHPVRVYLLRFCDLSDVSWVQNCKRKW